MYFQAHCLSDIRIGPKNYVKRQGALQHPGPAPGGLKAPLLGWGGGGQQDVKMWLKHRV